MTKAENKAVKTRKKTIVVFPSSQLGEVVSIH